MSQNQKNGSDNPFGKSMNDCDHENSVNELNEPIALEVFFDSFKKMENEAKVIQMIQEWEKSLKMKLNEFASLVEMYQKENVELKMKNQKLTEENKAFEEKLKKLEEMIKMNEQKIGETETEIMVAMHEMKVQLPTENWHDLLALVPRSQLGNVVSQIGDRQFARIIQSFLHDEAREITLRKMSIIPPRSYVPSDLPAVHVWPNKATDMPDWPMPGNVKEFKEIDLKYVDASVINFVRKFQENSLLENVNLYVRYCDYNTQTLDEPTLLRVLTQIVPLISSIHSIQIDSSYMDLFRMVYNKNNTNDANSQSHESQLLLKGMMAQARILYIYWLNNRNHQQIKCLWEDKLDWFCSWLYTPKDDGKPRMLKSHDSIYGTTDCYSFIERIKKDFEMAKNPVSFFIYTKIQNTNVEDISFENVKTNEKLVIRKMEEYRDWMLLIARYPLNAAKSWIAANEKEISKWKIWKFKRIINLDNDMTMTINSY